MQLMRRSTWMGLSAALITLACGGTPNDVPVTGPGTDTSAGTPEAETTTDTSTTDTPTTSTSSASSTGRDTEMTADTTTGGVVSTTGTSSGETADTFVSESTTENSSGETANDDASDSSLGSDTDCSAEICDGIDNDCDGVVDDNAGCPCDLLQYNAHAYLFCGIPKTWSDAQDTCASLGYDLVTVDDDPEHLWLSSEIDARWPAENDTRTWIGLNDIDIEGTFVWVSGAPVVYTHWNQNEPNGGTTENCGHQFFRDFNPALPAWNDMPCYQLAHQHVCESR